MKAALYRAMQNHRARAAVLLACLMTATASAGCASYQRVGITSAPAGADVYLDGELVGQTPVELRVSPVTDHSVMIKKPGYRSKLLVLNRNQPGDGIDFVTPADLSIQLVPDAGARDRDLEVEVE